MAELDTRAVDLRGELKAWEKQFADCNGGRKAGRDDIRANPSIAAKYKEYNKLRDIAAGRRKPEPPRSPCSKRSTRKHNASEPLPPPTTPSKRISDSFVTPSKRRHEDSGFLQATPTSAMKVTPHRLPNFIGPTPQKDGLVMGLFDFLPVETPSKNQRTVLGDLELNVHVAQTPSKRDHLGDEEGDDMERNRGSRTPMSAGKRFFLDKFATPSKRKREEEEGTPTSLAKRHSTTPTFLRRDVFAMDKIEEEEETRPRPLLFKKAGLVRSLSSMIQKARQQEEDRLDEELDMLREMEAEAEGDAPPQRSIPRILVEDSQAPEMPLGPDQLVESEDEGNPNQAGQPLRIWKKRGQKRQTRRFIMRPVRTLPTAPSEPNEGQSDEESEAEKVADTQPAGIDGDDSGSEYGSDASEASHSAKKSKKVAPPKSVKPAEKKEEGKIKKTVRKMNEAAHANYRRLKIKSKNPGGSGKGRFGRRR